MRLSYDPTVDALYIRLVDEPVECKGNPLRASRLRGEIVVFAVHSQVQLENLVAA